MGTGKMFANHAASTRILVAPARTSAKVNAILKSILEPRRDKWLERFLWTALLLKQKPDLLSPWMDFFIVAANSTGVAHSPTFRQCTGSPRCP